MSDTTVEFDGVDDAEMIAVILEELAEFRAEAEANHAAVLAALDRVQSR